MTRWPSAGAPGARGSSTSTGWCGWPSNPSRARPTPWRDCARPGDGVLFATNNASPTVAELRAPPGDGRDRGRARRHRHLGPGGRLDARAGVHGRGVRRRRRARGAGGAGRLGRGARGPPTPWWWAGPGASTSTSSPPRPRRCAAAPGFIGTNEDPTHPTPQRLLPGSGALLAAVATAAQATPEVAGKPHDPMVALLRARAPDAVLVVGDRPSTDGALARRLGLPFALVRTGRDLRRARADGGRARRGGRRPRRARVDAISTATA